MLLLLFLCSIILWVFSKSLAGDVKLIAQRLEDMANSKLDLNLTLKVTSNDEISDLVIAFNEIQKLEKQRIKQLEDYQNILIQRERLATLGESTGSVAHEINNPASAIQFGLANIEKITFSLVEDNLDEKEKQNKLSLLKKSINNNLSACRKILDIVGSIKNGTRNLSSEFIEDFRLSRAFNDLNFILSHKFVKNNSRLIIYEYKDVLIRGDSSKLFQAITNLVSNAVDAYKENGGNIEIRVTEDDSKGVIISVKDYAGGIPKNLRENIFNKMITTKGFEGTGLGLYISKSLIIGHYGGDIWFEVYERIGTTFFILIPFNEYNEQRWGGVLKDSI